MEVSIYIKSQFRGNSRGAGEAAAVIEYIDRFGKSHIRQQQVRVEYETRNVMNLEITIAAMRCLVKPCRITIFTGCDYMENACKLGWLKKWKQNGWKKANGQPPANVEEWRQFYMLTQIHSVTFRPYNPRHEGRLRKILEEKERISEENKGHCNGA